MCHQVLRDRTRLAKQYAHDIRHTFNVQRLRISSFWSPKTKTMWPWGDHEHRVITGPINSSGIINKTKCKPLTAVSVDLCWSLLKTDVSVLKVTKAWHWMLLPPWKRLWCHDHVWHEWQPCTLHHKPTLCCSSLVKSKPAGLHLEELKFKVKKLILLPNYWQNHLTKLANYWQNHLTKLASGSICIFSLFSGQRASLLGVPFK